ncbi:hypothetical protein [Pelagibacterium xiamenense]|uniref:hypothetical protein n=1 Tax=Pelagibacterium xiamenense TaxID=2901140 RepID=UPI001E6249A2|nr:hypothetical protein [Pelagibacterium xiamenense]MCD7060603.1 hypothetical protein [Pelagibacterium xiamenense]
MSALSAEAGVATAFFSVPPGGTVVAWALSPIEAVYYPGTPALAEDRVNYRFVNGFVDVGDLPCRVALWNEIKSRDVALRTDWPVESINLPGFNRRLDFSSFWHRPTRLARWCRTTLVPPADGDYPFSVATCGGVHIWVDGVLAARFEPFTRNAEHATTVTLPLKAAGSEVVMLSEDLAERDTTWYVEMTAMADVEIRSGVPGGASPADIGTLMALAADVRPAHDFVSTGPLVLVFDAPAGADVTVTARVQQSVHMRHKPPLFETQAVLRAGTNRVALAGLDTLSDGYHPLDLTFQIGDARVERHIGFALLRDETPPPLPEALEARKHAALAFAAEFGELRVGRALAMLSMGRRANGTLEAILSDTLAAIEQRRDCSDFVMVPLLWIYGAYKDKLPVALAQRVEMAILNYRYWVDEPGNDVMWFWSENHVLCFHVSQYLAGRLMPSGKFTASRRKGVDQARIATDRLGKWFDSVEAHGLAEWNSAAYYPIDFIGLLALEHWADGDIKARAKRLLDRLFTMIALHTLGGVAAGTQGRAYDKELHAGPLTELSPFAAVAFGEGWLNNGVAALPMFAAGTYAPPANLDRYASPPPGTALNAHYVQGYQNAGRLALHKRASVQLSASVGGEPGRKGHQQHLIDIRLASHPFARAWINHPGEDDPWGHQRPSYWAGNGVMPRIAQYDDAALMLYDLGDDPRVDFTHACAPASGFDEYALWNNWLILRAGRGFAALTASAPIVPVKTGPGAGREYRARGTRTAWAVIVGELAQGADIAIIKAMLGDTAFELDPVAMQATLSRHGRSTLTLDYATGLSVDGAPFTFPNPGLEPLVRASATPVLS